MRLRLLWLFAALALTGCSSSPSTVSPTAPSTFVMTWPTLAFPSTGLGAKAITPVVITLWNSSGSAVPVSSVTDSNTGEFPWTSTCTIGGSLAASSTCTVTAQFTPTATGARTATLTIKANGTSQDFALTGTAVAAVTPQLTIDLAAGPPSTIFTLTMSGGTPGGTLTLQTVFTPSQGNPVPVATSTTLLADSSGNAVVSTNADTPGTYENWIVDASSGLSTNHVTHVVTPQ